MYNFFEECEFTYEQISEKRVRKIRASVLSRIKEERIMKKSTVLRSVMLAATVAAIGAMSLVGSADTVPTEEKKVFDKVATFNIDADTDVCGTYLYDVKVTGDDTRIETESISLDGESYMFEATPDNANEVKIRVLTEDENGDVQTIDCDAYTYGLIYYNWNNNT